MSAAVTELPEHPIDFLGNVVLAGDTIVYPTGGTSARMVRARVHAVRDVRDTCYQVDEEVWDRVAHAWVKTGHQIWRGSSHDGWRGPTCFKLVVLRQQEGTKTRDDTKKVTVDQLHRVVSVTAIERKAQATHGPGWPD